MSTLDDLRAQDRALDWLATCEALVHPEPELAQRFVEIEETETEDAKEIARVRRAAHLAPAGMLLIIGTFLTAVGLHLPGPEVEAVGSLNLLVGSVIAGLLLRGRPQRPLLIEQLIPSPVRYELTVENMTVVVTRSHASAETRVELPLPPGTAEAAERFTEISDQVTDLQTHAAQERDAALRAYDLDPDVRTATLQQVVRRARTEMQTPAWTETLVAAHRARLSA